MPITSESLQAVWEAIRIRIPHAAQGAVLEQSLLLHNGIGLSAVIRTRDLMPGIVIRVPSRWPSVVWQVLRLTGVRFEPVIQDNQDLLLPVMLADEESAVIFAVFAADLASELTKAGTMEERIRLLMDKVGLWKRFFQKNSGPLSEEEVRGLIGELEILEKMIAAYGVDAALDSWKGPANELHDFHHDAFRIEVKTWMNESSPRIFISNPSQIVIDAGWPVFIAAVQIAKDNFAGLTLSEPVSTLLATMRAPQKRIMEVLLADVGYLPVHAELYSNRYLVREAVIYRVADGFPLIDPATLPGGITNLKYALELGALTPFITSSPIEK